MKRLLLIAVLACAGCTPRIVPGRDYTKKIPTGFMTNCKPDHPDDPNNYIVTCDPAYNEVPITECPNKSDVILTGNDGRHWCLKVK